MVDKNDTLPSSVSTVNERWCGDSLISPHRGRQAMDRTVIYTLPRNVHIEPGLVGVLLPGVLGSGKLRREGTSRGGLLLACGYFPPGLCFRVSDRDARGVNLSCLGVIRAAVTAGSPLETGLSSVPGLEPLCVNEVRCGSLSCSTSDGDKGDPLKPGWKRVDEAGGRTRADRLSLSWVLASIDPTCVL